MNKKFKILSKGDCFKAFELINEKYMPIQLFPNYEISDIDFVSLPQNVLINSRLYLKEYTTTECETLSEVKQIIESAINL